MRKGSVLLSLTFLLALVALTACAPSVTTKTSSGLEGDNSYASYNGPRAKVVVADFTCPVARCPSGVSDSISELLVTAMINTNHFILYDRSVLAQIQQEAYLGGKPLNLQGAELLVVGSITSFEPDAGGTRGGGGGFLGGVLGALGGGQKRSYVAVDMRLVDAQSGAIVSAFRVEGEATDVDYGGILGFLVPSAALGGSLRQYEKTPMGKALAVMTSKAVEEIIKRTPRSYFKYAPDGKPYQQP